MRIARAAFGIVLSLGLAQEVSAQKLLTEGIKDLATQISESAAKGQKRRIAVVPLRELDGRTTVLGTYIAEELVTDLFAVGKLEIVERGLLDKVLGELKLGASGVIDPETAKQVGRLAGVDAIVTGTVTDLQSLVALNCRLIDTQTGRIFAAAQTKIIKDEDVKKIMGVVMSGGAVSSGSQGPVGVASGSPVHSDAGSADAGSRRPTFETDSYRVIVDSVKKTGGIVTMGITVESLTEKALRVNFCCQTYLVDEGGERWDYVPQDTAQFFGGGADLVAHTKRKTSVRFQSKGDTSGRLFTLSTSDWPSNQPIVLRDLK